jgi:hypothetical protein
MVDLIPEVIERLYRDLASPKPPQPQPARVDTTAKKIELTRADVDQIIQRTRGASPDELQYLIDNGSGYRLTPGERNQLGVDLSIIVAQRARQINGRREDPNAQFIAQVLGYAETPWGLIEREWIDAQLRAGSQAIQRCRSHKPPVCQCWSASRAILWQARANGDKTPEGWAAARICAFLEELELASRPETGPERSATLVTAGLQV